VVGVLWRMQEPFWQCWLFDLLAHIQDVKLRAFEESNSLNMLEEEETLIYDIFAIIHLYCTYHVKGGWRHVERTINATHLYADKVFFFIRVQKYLCSALLNVFCL
jgi:hypothetical protein